jgi:hypothetical protein
MLAVSVRPYRLAGARYSSTFGTPLDKNVIMPSIKSIIKVLKVRYISDNRECRSADSVRHHGPGVVGKSQHLGEGASEVPPTGDPHPDNRK